MDKNTVKIIGIKKTPKKDNPEVIYYNYFYTQPFSDYDVEHSEVFGIYSGMEFSMKDIGCNVGDEVEFIYRKGFQDKAQLDGCKIIKSAVGSQIK